MGGIENGITLRIRANLRVLMVKSKIYAMAINKTGIVGANIPDPYVYVSFCYLTSNIIGLYLTILKNFNRNR